MTPRRPPGRLLRAALFVAALLLALPAQADISLRDGFAPRLGKVEKLMQQARGLQVPQEALSTVLLRQSFGPKPEPQTLFFFVRDQILFEPYEGARRGPRGALLARAGNSLDQSLLLMELLQGSGQEARLAWGDLDGEQTTTLLESFTGQAQLSPPPDAKLPTYQVEQDLALRRSVKRHYWVEFSQNKQWVALDPTFPRATYGVTATKRLGGDAQIPARDQISASIKVMALEENGTAPIEALEIKRALPELSWRNITLRFDTEGRKAEKRRPRVNISGEDTTGRPFRLQGVQRIWLEYSFERGGRARQVITRELHRRGSQQDLFASDQQVFSLMLMPGWSSGPFLTEIARRELERLYQGSAQMQRKLTQDSERALRERELNQELNLWLDDLLSGAAGLMTLTFADVSDRYARGVAQDLGVRAFYETPRIIMVAGVRRADRLFWQIDLRNDEIRAVPAQGLPPVMAHAFQAHRGHFNSYFESAVLRRLTGAHILGLDSYMAQASQQQAWTTAHPANLDKVLSGLKGVNPEVRFHLEDAVRQRGRAALLPAQPVPIGDVNMLAWWELSPEGHILGVREDGTHGAFSESMLTGAPGVPPEASSELLDLSFNQALILLENLTQTVSALIQSQPDVCQVSCQAQRNLYRLPQQLCLERPKPPRAWADADFAACLEPPSEKQKSNDFLGLGFGQTCQELTRPARCGALVSSQVLYGPWSVQYTRAHPKLDTEGTWGRAAPLSQANQCKCR